MSRCKALQSLVLSVSVINGMYYRIRTALESLKSTRVGFSNPSYARDIGKGVWFFG